MKKNHTFLQMLQRYTKARLNNVPVSGIWIQDWAGVLKTSFGSRLFWDWKWNQKLYPSMINLKDEYLSERNK